MFAQSIREGLKNFEDYEEVSERIKDCEGVS